MLQTPFARSQQWHVQWHVPLSKAFPLCKQGWIALTRKVSKRESECNALVRVCECVFWYV